MYDVETQRGETFKQGYFAERPAGQLFLHDEAADEGEGPVLWQELLDDIGTQIIFFHAAVERGQIENVESGEVYLYGVSFLPGQKCLQEGGRGRPSFRPGRGRRPIPDAEGWPVGVREGETQCVQSMTGTLSPSFFSMAVFMAS